MKNGNRSNALLVELLIVIMFFMLASTVLLQVFAAAHQQSDRSGQMISILNRAQDLMDRLYAADHPNLLLAENGFKQKDESSWENNGNEYEGMNCLIVLSDQPTKNGVLHYFNLSIKDNQDQTLISLKNARYQEEME